MFNETATNVWDHADQCWVWRRVQSSQRHRVRIVNDESYENHISAREQDTNREALYAVSITRKPLTCARERKSEDGVCSAMRVRWKADRGADATYLGIGQQRMVLFGEITADLVVVDAFGLVALLQFFTDDSCLHSSHP